MAGSASWWVCFGPLAGTERDEWLAASGGCAGGQWQQYIAGAGRRAPGIDKSSQWQVLRNMCPIDL